MTLPPLGTRPFFWDNDFVALQFCSMDLEKNLWIVKGVYLCETPYCCTASTPSLSVANRFTDLWMVLQHAATHRCIRIEKPFAVSLTLENPYLLDKQTILSEANALTKKINVNGMSLSVVWHTSLRDSRTCILDFVMGFQKRGFILTFIKQY